MVLFTENALGTETYCKSSLPSLQFCRKGCVVVSQCADFSSFQANQNSQHWCNPCRSWHFWKQVLWETTWHSVWLVRHPLVELLQFFYCRILLHAHIRMFTIKLIDIAALERTASDSILIIFCCLRFCLSSLLFSNAWVRNFANEHSKPDDLYLNIVQSSGRHRWVEYADKGRYNASQVPAEWHGWLHHITDSTGDKASFL